MKQSLQIAHREYKEAENRRGNQRTKHSINGLVHILEENQFGRIYFITFKPLAAKLKSALSKKKTKQQNNKYIQSKKKKELTG